MNKECRVCGGEVKNLKHSFGKTYCRTVYFCSSKCAREGEETIKKMLPEMMTKENANNAQLLSIVEEMMYVELGMNDSVREICHLSMSLEKLTKNEDFWKNTTPQTRKSLLRWIGEKIETIDKEYTKIKKIHNSIKNMQGE